MDVGNDRMSMDAKMDDVESKDAVMPDIYADEPVAKPARIIVVTRSSDDDDESVGFDPYDTATLHKK